MTETVPESRPIIDFSNDDDIKQGKWMNDSELIMKGWADNIYITFGSYLYRLMS